jgi:hypothetical protein
VDAHGARAKRQQDQHHTRKGVQTHVVRVAIPMPRWIPAESSDPDTRPLDVCALLRSSGTILVLAASNDSRPLPAI